MVRKNLITLLWFSCALIICLTIGYALRYNIPIFKIGNSTTSVQTKTSGTTPATTGFSCPKGEWVDCMPTIGGPKKIMCSAAYLNWAKLNCPNFKGAAL
jgi:hypothetical protein